MLKKPALVCLMVFVMYLYSYGQTELPQEQAGEGKTISAPAEQVANRIDQLVVKLGSRFCNDREKAYSELKRLLKIKSSTMLERLRRGYENVKHQEAKQRLEKMLAPYDRWQITPAVLEKVPDITELLDEWAFKGTPAVIEKLRKSRPEGASGVLIRIIIEAVRGSRLDIQRSAVDALVELGEVAIEPLDKVLRNSKNRGVRLNATEALGRICGDRVIEPLILGLKDEDYFVRVSAADGLLLAGKGAVPLLLREIKGEDKEVAGWAAYALGKIEDKDSIAPLIEMLTHEDSSVRYHAAHALAPMGEKAALEPLMKALKDENALVRRSAARALGNIGDKGAVEPLTGALTDENEHVRMYAVRSLGQIGDKRAVKALAGALGDKEAIVRRISAEALGKIGEAGAGDSLIEALKDTKWRVRSAAARALGATREMKAERALRKLWKEDTDREVQLAAACGLTILSADNEAFRFLVKALDDKEEDIRYEAAKNITQIGGQKALKLLIKALENKDSHIREVAVRALGNKGVKEAVEPIIMILSTNECSNARSYAAEALGRIGDKSAVEPLISVLKDRHWNVRYNVVKALKAITGEQIGCEYAKWKDWYEKNKDK